MISFLTDGLMDFSLQISTGILNLPSNNSLNSNFFSNKSIVSGVNSTIMSISFAFSDRAIEPKKPI